MDRKRYGEDDILRLIREVEVHCNSGMDVVSACRTSLRKFRQKTRFCVILFKIDKV